MEQVQNAKKVIVEKIAFVSIRFDGDPEVSDKGFVRFFVQSTGGGVEEGRKLFIFDHRKETYEAAKIFNSKENNSWEDRVTLSELLSRKAKVVVMEKNSNQYINLFPTEEGGEAFLSTTAYTSKHNAGYNIDVNESFWSWESQSSSRTGRHGEMLLVALTDNDHKVVVNCYGYANIGHDDKNLTVMGLEIKSMSSEEFAVDMEP